MRAQRFEAGKEGAAARGRVEGEGASFGTQGAEILGGVGTRTRAGFARNGPGPHRRRTAG